ncbi:MAG: Asp-tRNA(Asn)/Glu-tRNA(Gln) amidotransferase subunit GatA [Acidimicrobiia bacterium]|nr:Asp-tRNA(Asn)/Glu-tRNA(Gln) amidotransferase subunit GatA [Acidimicrobiia bacterium]NNF10764.1 Asp-tRNA(Asn)/Glu-tRNA(Gln) amidotransferase subunit GatA [Acidimicrobiia bacterium]NNL69207.1 Asp-tRNA(Asn)/Glu-tRNA(Gln) amidotransferase subunit GatA [Acidimicrobiia bacterium]
MSDLADLSVGGAAAGLRAGEFTAVELLEAVHRRAAVTEAELHAYLTIDRDGAARAAVAADSALRAADDPGPLLGIPVALKDNMVTRGVETTCSSKILSGYRPPYDGTAVSRLRAGGAVIFGKTNLDEFAMGSSTENSAYGPTRNPWDPERVPGGSSGGSAAAVAAGSAMIAYGSDTGGSIRQPAALCGIVGVKPTYGLVSRYGLIAFASSLDQIGPLTRTVEDAVAALEVVGGHDPADSTSYPGSFPDMRSGLEAGVSGLRIGVVAELNGAGIDPAVQAAVDETVAGLERAGATVVPVSLPSVAYALSAYYLIAPAECSANLARFDGVRYGLRRHGETVEEMMSTTRGEGFGPEVTRRILLGTYALSAGYYDAFYGQAQRVRTLIIQDFADAYEQADVLVSPTSPTTAFPLGARTEDPLSMYLSDVCTIPSNMSGDPAISVPVGVDENGLPVGFQIMAPALGEPVMMRVAAEVERQAGFTARARLATSEVG